MLNLKERRIGRVATDRHVCIPCRELVKNLILNRMRLNGGLVFGAGESNIDNNYVMICLKIRGELQKGFKQGHSMICCVFKAL